MTTTTLDTKTLIQELRDAHSLSTKGTWGKGSTTHETVSTTEGQKPYHIASFHHANDAQFCDLMHAYLPRILDELEAQLAAVQQGVQLPFTYAIADSYGQPFFEEEGCVSPEAKDLQPEVDSLNQNLDGEPPYKVVALYTHPTQQGLDARITATPKPGGLQAKALITWSFGEKEPVIEIRNWAFNSNGSDVPYPMAAAHALANLLLGEFKRNTATTNVISQGTELAAQAKQGGV